MGKRAESLKDYLKKGAAVDVILRPAHRDLAEEDQTTGFKLVGKVLELEFAGGRGDASQSSGRDDRRLAFMAASNLAGRRRLAISTTSRTTCPSDGHAQPIRPPLRPVAPARQALLRAGARDAC